MSGFLRSYFSYPLLPTGEATERARTFFRVAIGFLVIATLFLLLLSVIEPGTLQRRLVSIGLATAVVLPLLEVNRRGHSQLAGILLITGLVAVVTRAALTSGGLATPIGFFMIFFVALGGLLFSARGVIVCAVLLVLLGFVLLLLDRFGLLPQRALYFSPLTTWLYAAICMGGSVLVHREVSGTMGRSLRRAQEEIEARRKARERLRLAIEAGDLGVWVQDVRTGVIHADPGLFELFGIPLTEEQAAPYTAWFDRIHPDDRARATAAMEDALAGAGIRVEFRVLRPDGTVRHVESTGVRESGNDDSAQTVVGMVRDVTAARLAEMERERLVHDLGERVKELRLLHFAARLLRPDRSFDRELVEQLVAQISPAWQYPEVCEARLTYGVLSVATPGWRRTEWLLSTEFQTNDLVGCIEVVYTEPRPDEQEGPFLAEERALLESLGEILVSYLDLRQHREELESLVATRTRQMREARDEAERASRAKGDFLATMSHEIRTPMNAILGYSQLLRRDPSLGKAQHERLDAILSSGDHLLTLINNVLDMSKIEAGKTTLAPAPVDLQALLEELRRMSAALVAARSLELVFEGVARLPRVVSIDAGRVRQVVINLLSNALKFSRRGDIRLWASAESTSMGYRVTIAVTDSGPGIAPGQMSRIFEVFEQSELGVRAGGAGLGLPISRELARLMGGDLTVSSEVGVGSTFTFTFDAGLADAAVLAQARRAVGIRTPGRRPKVLVVDDQPDNLTIADELLRAVGFQTRLAMNGEEALAAFADWHPDAALMDVRMPGMSGIEVIRRLRAEGVLTPIVVCTASGLDQLAAEARAAGAEEVLFKPYKEADLLAVVGRLLKLEYIYEEVVDREAADQPGLPAVAPLRALCEGVPAQLLDQLLVASIQARTGQVELLAGEVAAYSQPAADRIRKLVREFRHDELIAGLQAAIAGA